MKEIIVDENLEQLNEQLNKLPLVSIYDELTKYEPVNEGPADYEYLSMRFRVGKDGVHRLINIDFKKFRKKQKRE